MAPAAIDGSTDPSARVSVSSTRASAARNATATKGCGGPNPDTVTATAIASSPDAIAYATTTTAEPSQRPRIRSARRSGLASSASATPDSRSPPTAGAPTNAAVIASTKLNMNAIRIRTCETPIRISSSSTPSAREVHQSREAERDQEDGHDRQADEDPHDAPPDELLNREAGDDDHDARWRSADRHAVIASSRNRASSDPRPGSTAWTRPPAATMAATRSGIRAGSSGRTVSQSSSTVERTERRHEGLPTGSSRSGHPESDAVRPRRHRRAGPRRSSGRGGG